MQGALAAAPLVVGTHIAEHRIVAAHAQPVCSRWVTCAKRVQRQGSPASPVPAGTVVQQKQVSQWTQRERQSSKCQVPSAFTSVAFCHALSLASKAPAARTEVFAGAYLKVIGDPDSCVQAACQAAGRSSAWTATCR